MNDCKKENTHHIPVYIEAKPARHGCMMMAQDNVNSKKRNAVPWRFKTKQKSKNNKQTKNLFLLFFVFKNLHTDRQVDFRLVLLNQVIEYDDNTH